MRFTPILLGLVLLSGAAPPALAASPADARFKAIYTQEWTWRRAQNGDEGEGADDDAVRSRLPSQDAATQARRLDYWTKVLAKLDALDPKALSVTERENYAVYRAQIRMLLNQQRFREWEKPLTGDSAFWRM